ncbi:MAG: winged helix-turn-helix domain-containing protein [Gemmatimonadaceae bacterium]|nr:winged helix-turn-helix domain-containing protein [Gemmatimonadaceae bacterium]
MLSLRLLDALAQDAPQFVESATLIARVWPDQHISADALKQRVRQLRGTLAEVGYEPRLIDSARGEGYALLAALEDFVPGAPAAVNPERTPSLQSDGLTSRRTAVWVGLALGAAALALWVLSPRQSADMRDGRLGPTPVRIAYDSSAERAASPAVFRGAARLPDVLLVAASAGTACNDVARAHLCLRVVAGDSGGAEPTNAAAAFGGAPRVLELLQVESGAVLLRSDLLRAADPDTAVFVLQLAQFATPGVMRWLGGRTGAGDREFSAYREGVRLLGTCGGATPAQDLQRVMDASRRAPNFLALRALALLLAVEDALARDDTAALVPLRDDAEELLRADGQLALAHVALARSLSASHSDVAEHVARALRLQPILSAFSGAQSVPRLVAAQDCD